MKVNLEKVSNSLDRSVKRQVSQSAGVGFASTDHAPAGRSRQVDRPLAAAQIRLHVPYTKFSNVYVFCG